MPCPSFEEISINASHTQLIQTPCFVTKTVEEYQTADIAKDVTAALKRGELRYVALGGYTLWVPEIEEFESREAGTNEVCQANIDTCTTGGLRLFATAHYASCYNKLMRQFRKK